MNTTNADTTNPYRSKFLHLQGQTHELQLIGNHPTDVPGSVQVCIDLHTSQWVFMARNLGRVQSTHCQFRHNKPLQKNIFVSPRQTLYVATCNSVGITQLKYHQVVCKNALGLAQMSWVCGPQPATDIMLCFQGWLKPLPGRLGEVILSFDQKPLVLGVLALHSFSTRWVLQY